MIPTRYYRAIGNRNANVAQIQRRIAFMQHVVVIGKADKFAARAENMHMAAAAQRAGV